MCQPRRIFIETIIVKSLAEDFEEVMREWVQVGKIYRHEVNFTHNCDLCGAAVYKTNYVIQNIKTHSKLQIGSECIKRFTYSHSEFVEAHPLYLRKLRKRHQQRQLRLKLIDQYHLICNQGFPQEYLFKDFRNGLIKLLKSYNKLSLLKSRKGAIKILTKLLNQASYTDLEILRLQLILDEPYKARKIFIRAPRNSRKKIDKYGIVIDA